MVRNSTASGWTKKGAVYALTLTACLLFGGCDNYKGKLTKSNFDRIHNRMPRKEVEELLGPGQTVPAQQGDMTGFFDKARQVKITRVRWQDGKRSILATFFDDEVAPGPDGSGLKHREGF